MEIIIFAAGFILGGIAVFLPFYMSRKSESAAKEAILEQMKLYFENTANRVIKDSSAQLSERNSEKLEEFFNRFKDRIEDFEKLAKENLKTESENFLNFDTNIKRFLEAGNQISKDAGSLVNVMKSDNRRQGHWGEIVLAKVLEASHLRKDEDYELQSKTTDGIPDATIKLPEGRLVFVDAKTSFSSWYSYVNAGDDAARESCLKQFKDSTKSHISGLAKRGYWKDKTSPDFVLMFIPIEGCYSLMFCDDCELWKFAWEKEVMPVSPSTLLAALRIIEAFYVVDRQNKNVLAMAELCGSLYDKAAALYSDLLKTRDNLNSALVKLDGKGNILSKIKKIENLGGVISKKLPELPAEADAEEA